MSKKNHITKLQSRQAVKQTAVQPVVMLTRHWRGLQNLCEDMKGLKSGLKFLCIVLFSAIITIIIAIMLPVSLSDTLFTILFLIIYGVLLFIWIKIDKNWNK